LTLRLLDTFSGIGGFSLAARWLGGFQTVQFVERDSYCQRILRKHWPDVPIHDDICTFHPEPGSADVVCGGFPCQDISIAGQRAGIGLGTRSGLFYELLRVVREVGARYLVMENVAGICSDGLATVLGELANDGRACEWACVSAADLGAWHVRNRWWAVSYPDGYRMEGSTEKPIHWQPALARSQNLREFEALRDGPAFGTPKLCRGADGIPAGLDRLRALGNAVVPQVAAIPLARVLQLSAVTR
jgi:DNA (cytosine-5)-methyltransferase 1